MKFMSIKIVAVFGLLVFGTEIIHSQDTSGVYITTDLSGQIVLLPSYIDEEFIEDPFEFNVDGYLAYAFEIGKNFPIGQIGVYYRHGKSLQSQDFEKVGGFNEEVDFESFLNLGVNFKRVLWKNKERKKFELMLNYRASATYHNFSGKQYFEGETFETGNIEDFSESVFGLEMALYLQFGLRQNEKENRVKIIWEPIYVRPQTKGIGLGVQKLGIQVKI